MRNRSRAAVASFVVTVACGSGGPTITARDLARIMPSAADAPADTALAAEDSGPKTVDEITAEQDVRTRLRELGFQVGYVSVFTTENWNPDPAKATPGARFYGSFAIVLRDGDQAKTALRFYGSRLKRRAQGFTPVITTDLGDEAFGFRFSRLDDTPSPGLGFLWRVGNALFSVVGVGVPDPDPDATRRLASLIDGRARP